jgi:hypothetical protein
MSDVRRREFGLRTSDFGASVAPGATWPFQRVSPTAATIKEFHGRLDRYLKLHREAEAKVGPIPKSSNPAAITKHEQALGEAIRSARPVAREGDLFTSPVAALLRRLIARNLAGRRDLDRHAFIVSQPEAALHVNDSYPSTIPLGTVPAGLLKALPTLPDGLDYRFVNTALILRDRDANLVVDILPGAVPSRFGTR